MTVDYLQMINDHREQSDEDASENPKQAPVLHAVKRKSLTNKRSRSSISSGAQSKSRRTRRVKKHATRSDISTDEALEMARKKKSKAKSSVKAKRRKSRAAATVAVKEARKKHRRGRAKAKTAAKTAAKTRRKHRRAKAKAASVVKVRRRRSRAKAKAGSVAKVRHRRRKAHAKAKSTVKARKRHRRAHAPKAQTRKRRRKAHAPKIAVKAKTRASAGKRRKKSHAYAGKKRKHSRASARSKSYAKKHHRRSKERYALENPLSGTELAVGALTLAIGFGVADVTDRYLATHALEKGRLNTDGVAAGTGAEHLVDNGAKDGAYKGLTNGTAVLAPMDMKRWLVGGVLTALPLGLAHFVKADVGRSALQFFGFGVGARILGKALVDGVAYLSRKSAFGQRLYNYENVARAVEKKDTDAMAYLPYYGATADGLTGRGLTFKPDGTLGALPLGLGGCRPLRYTTQEVVSTPPPPVLAPPPPPAPSAVAPLAPPVPAAPPVAVMPPRVLSPISPTVPAFSPAPPPPPAFPSRPTGSVSTEGGGVPARSGGSVSTESGGVPARPSGSASTESGGTPMRPSGSPPEEPRDRAVPTPPRGIPTRESPEGAGPFMSVMQAGESIPVPPPSSSPEGVMLSEAAARGARGMFAPTGAGRPGRKSPFLWGYQGEE